MGEDILEKLVWGAVKASVEARYAARMIAMGERSIVDIISSVGTVYKCVCAVVIFLIMWVVEFLVSVLLYYAAWVVRSFFVV